MKFTAKDARKYTGAPLPKKPEPETLELGELEVETGVKKRKKKKPAGFEAAGRPTAITGGY